MRKIISVLILIHIMCLPALSADFLTGARGGGLGFSYSVLADDPSGALYNPSALGFVRGWQSQLMYISQNDYIYTDWEEIPYNGLLGAVFYKPEWGGFALNAIQSGSLSKLTNVPTFNYLVASWGREFSPGLAGGASIKLLRENGFGERSAFDLDLGITYRSRFRMIFAAAFENMARSKLSPEYLGITEYLPRRERVGVGYIIDHDKFQAALILAGQMEESGIFEKHTTSLVNFGTEWWFAPFERFSFAARAGYTFGDGVVYDVKSDYARPSIGFSFVRKIGYSNLRFDYALQAYPFETIDGSTPSDHYFALTYGWGGVPDYGNYDVDDYPDDLPLYRPKPPSKPEIFNPQPDSDIKPPVIDKDTDFYKREFVRYDVEMEVTDISAMDFKRIVFYLRPQKIIKTNSWKLYIFKAKIKSWNTDEIDRWALKVIEGRGVPPINVVWDAVSRDGRLLPGGKYYYILTAVDAFGQNYATKWHKFRID